MALSATIRRFEIQLSDVDRGVYDALSLQAAQHPSESPLYLVTRVLARCMEHRDDLEFGRGVSSPDEPDIFARHPTGAMDLWIEIGLPAPDRLHKIAKQADHVRVYAHKEAGQLAEALRAGEIHRADEIQLFEFTPSLLAALADSLQKKNHWEVLRSEGQIYVTVGEKTAEGRVVLSHP